MSKVALGRAEKVLSKTFLDNVKNLSEDEIGELVLKAELKMKEIKEEEEADEKLASARQIVKDLSQSYKAAKAYEAAKIQFLIEKLSEIQESVED